MPIILILVYFRRRRTFGEICNWPTNRFLLESLLNASILFILQRTESSEKTRQPWQSNPPAYRSCEPKEVIPAHHYPALLIIIPSCLWPDPDCPSTMNIIKCEPRCTVILPLIPPHQETKTRNKQRAGGKNLGPFVSSPFVPLAWWLWSLQKWKWKMIELAQWGLFYRDGVAQIRSHDPFVGVFINPTYSASTFGFANEERGPWLDSTCQHHLSPAESVGWQLWFPVPKPGPWFID